MNKTNTLTGAGAIMQVAHIAPNRRVHGHTYEIVGWWRGEPCAVDMQRRLVQWIEKFDHGQLPPNMSRAEAIASQCMMALNCAAVDVNRPLERLFARVSHGDEQ